MGSARVGSNPAIVAIPVECVASSGSLQKVRIKPMAGIEPTTSRLLSECSTAKLHWQAFTDIRANKFSLPFFFTCVKFRSELFASFLFCVAPCGSRVLRFAPPNVALGFLLPCSASCFWHLSHMNLAKRISRGVRDRPSKPNTRANSSKEETKVRRCFFGRPAHA